MSKTLYKTPFSRAYWKDALADSKKLRTLVFSALMVAASVALGYLRSVPVVNDITVSWGFLARALCALVGGPVNALLFGFVEDTVGYFMDPRGGYNPFYIFTTMLGVFISALFLYRAEETVLRGVPGQAGHQHPERVSRRPGHLPVVFRRQGLLGHRGRERDQKCHYAAGADHHACGAVRRPAAHPPPHGLPARPGGAAEAVAYFFSREKVGKKSFKPVTNRFFTLNVLRRQRHIEQNYRRADHRQGT